MPTSHEQGAVKIEITEDLQWEAHAADGCLAGLFSVILGIHRGQPDRYVEIPEIDPNINPETGLPYETGEGLKPLGGVVIGVGMKETDPTRPQNKK